MHFAVATKRSTISFYLRPDFRRHSRAYIMQFSPDISVYRIGASFRHDARPVKIDAYRSSYLYKARFLRREPSRRFIYRAQPRRTIVPVLHKTYRILRRAGVSKIYHANITQTRYAVAREIPPPSPAARAPLLCALRPFREFLARKCWRAYKTRCNSIKSRFRY